MDKLALPKFVDFSLALEQRKKELLQIYYEEEKKKEQEKKQEKMKNEMHTQHQK